MVTWDADTAKSFRRGAEPALNGARPIVDGAAAIGPLYVVEDDVMFRDSVAFMLRSAGIVVADPMTGRDFVAIAERLPPGCVLVDLRMPEVDGFAVLAALAPRSREFPAIVVTGHGDRASAETAGRLGAVAFLQKPFDECVLLAAIASATRHLRNTDRYTPTLGQRGRLSPRVT